MHIDVSGSNATVEHILGEVQRKWREGYVLVALNGLELEDCDGTRGEASTCMYYVSALPPLPILCLSL